MNNTNNTAKLPPTIRLIVALAAVPSLLLAVMIVISAFDQGITSIGVFEVLYSLVGVLALYIAITGKRLF
ncbi:hypothetical protein GCM10009092_13520 [Bowmanella denitrificans]|uniref:Uncharacterized protein n=1 Tax=Bowmanella denitrificans TaxID=366582 RepID=A0ABN0WYI0_9ALTE